MARYKGDRNPGQACEKSDGCRGTNEAGQCRQREGTLLSSGLLKREGEVIAVRLETPDKIRDLQRRLYLKAKRVPSNALR